MRKIVYLLSEKFENIDFIVVSASTVIASAISFLFSVISRRYLSPLEYGTYSTCLLLQTYISYGQLGVLNSYNRDYPQLIGAEEKGKSNMLKNTAFTFSSSIYFFIDIAVILIFSFLYYIRRISLEYCVGYILSAVLVLLNNISDFGMNTIRMEGGYNYTAFVNVFRVVIAASVGFVGIKYWGYFGIYVMPLTMAGISICLYFRRAFKCLKIKINTKVLKNSLLTGAPLMINNLIWTIVASVDKFVILGFMSTELLGIYSIAQLGFSITVLIPQSIAQVFYIKISTVYGKRKDENELIRLCNDYTMINSLCTSIICVLGYYLLPIFVDIVMPKYTNGIFASQIMLLGVAIYSSTILYGNVFSVLRLNSELLWTSAVLCVFNTCFSIALVTGFGRTIENVAIGTSISYAAYTLLIIHKLSQRFHVRKVIFMKKCWLPVGVIVLPAIVTEYVLENRYMSFLFSLIWMGIAGFISIQKIKESKLI